LRVALTAKEFSIDGEPTVNAVAWAVTDARGAYFFTANNSRAYTVINDSLSNAGDIYVPAESPVFKLSSSGTDTIINLAVIRGRRVTIGGNFVDGLGHRYPHLDWVGLEWRGPIPFMAPSKAVRWNERYKNAERYS